MRWAVAAVVCALVAVIGANVLLLDYGGTRHDPVGRLSPVARLPSPTTTPQPARQPAPTPADEGNDD